MFELLLGISIMVISVLISYFILIRAIASKRFNFLGIVTGVLTMFLGMSCGMFIVLVT